MADQIATGLSSDKASNPRHVKRFLNVFGIRMEIAKQHGVTIKPDVLAKLYLFEDRFLNEFEHLVSLPDAERREPLSQWEKWARKEDKAALPAKTSRSSSRKVPASVASAATRRPSR